ncbi:MAG: hypothetical protein QOD32_1842 [Pyrinomonadaceae bacterium]|jgi:hypothetical protein|nr:hypothetical protein [Pyrinomonadaceae bacterium]
MPNSKIDNSDAPETAASHRHTELEEDFERQRIHPLYRVLEDEFIHQHGALPPGYLEAKRRINPEVDARIEAEIREEMKEEIERVVAEERKELHRRRMKPDVSEEELYRYAASETEGSRPPAAVSCP